MTRHKHNFIHLYTDASQMSYRNNQNTTIMKK